MYYLNFLSHNGAKVLIKPCWNLNNCDCKIDISWCLHDVQIQERTLVKWQKHRHFNTTSKKLRPHCASARTQLVGGDIRQLELGFFMYSDADSIIVVSLWIKNIFWSRIWIHMHKRFHEIFLEFFIIEYRKKTEVSNEISSLQMRFQKNFDPIFGGASFLER